MPSNVAASYGLSLGAGNNMMANANQTTATSGNAMQGANSYLNTSIGGFGQAGNTLSQGFGNQMQQFNANQAGTNALMGAAGGAMGMFMAEGGMPEDAYDSQPGPIDYGEGDGSGIDDQVPIMASRDEYIIPADVVRAKGVEFFDKLVARYHTPAEEQREQQSDYPDKVRSGRALNPAPRRADGGSAKGGNPGQSPLQLAQLQDLAAQIGSKGRPPAAAPLAAAAPAVGAAPAQAGARLGDFMPRGRGGFFGRGAGRTGIPAPGAGNAMQGVSNAFNQATAIPMPQNPNTGLAMSI
jgi:hypothetical protein